MIDYTFQKPATVTDQQILNLYQSVDWIAYTKQPQKTLSAINNSEVLWAMLDGKLVGLCRGITDKQTILYIQDILVEPAFQRQQIGTNLVKKFLDKFNNIGQTVLITDPEEKTKQFYQSLGFMQIMPDKYGWAFVLERRFK